MDLSPSAFKAEIWLPEHRELWARIQRHDFEPDRPLNFLARLARDQGLTQAQARMAVEAYRRFCFLATVSPSPMTPSEIVDEVWHLHLIYSRDYWDIWCGQVLRKPLHHDPTPGGREAQQLYRVQYAQTLALHERFFGPPSTDLWPATHERFGFKPRGRMADLMRFVAPAGLRGKFRRVFLR